jgi:hypothetical protein
MSQQDDCHQEKLWNTCYKILKLYQVISKAHQNAQLFLISFFQNECVVKGELLRIYLVFFNNASRIFHETISVLEKSDLVTTETYNVMLLFRNKILNRMKDKFVEGGG